MYKIVHLNQSHIKVTIALLIARNKGRPAVLLAHINRSTFYALKISCLVNKRRYCRFIYKSTIRQRYEFLTERPIDR